METLSPHEHPRFAPEIAARCVAIEPVFYGLFSSDPAANLAAVERLVGTPGSDLGGGAAWVQGDTLAGFASVYDNRRAMAVQFTTLKILMAARPQRPDTRALVAAFNAEVPRVTGPSLYLSKIFVTESFRGRGLARQILAGLHQRASDEGLEGVSLHVRADNAAALALYASEGYAVVDGSAIYRVLLRRP